jgi:protein-disulfide isomerase
MAAMLGMLISFAGGYVLGTHGGKTQEGDKGPPPLMQKIARKAVPLGQSPVLGPEDARVTIVEFADFQCHYCAKSLPLQQRLLAEYKGRVRWVFKHLPLSFHSRALEAAQASMAAGAQGRFWAYHDLLFSRPSRLDLADLEAGAKELGLNLEQFREDLSQKKYQRQIEADRALAEKLGVDGTPSYFINGLPFSGAMTYQQMEKVVRKELAQSQELLRQGVAAKDLYGTITSDRAAAR